VNFIQVYRNGVLLGNADFTATSGTTVVLATAATAGDLVTTISFFVSSVLGAIPATSGAVTTPYILDGAVTQAKLGTNVAGNGPAFSAYLNTTQSITANTMTKVQMNAVAFDTASCFNTSTYRFTPNVAGYYQINYVAVMGGSNLTNMQAFIYKNGIAATSPYFYAPSVSGINNYSLTQSKLIYMNGSTDYIDFYTYIGATSPSLVGDGTNIYTLATGFLARSA
jgi:hypothetical protein